MRLLTKPIYRYAEGDGLICVGFQVTVNGEPLGVDFVVLIIEIGVADTRYIGRELCCDGFYIVETDPATVGATPSGAVYGFLLQNFNLCALVIAVYLLAAGGGANVQGGGGDNAPP
jgi:hypothetical protein